MSKKPDLDELRYYEDKEIERKLITSAWNELDRFHRIRTLHHTDFQDPLCERAYLAMIAVVAESQTVDMIRVCYFLRSTGHAQDAEAADVLARYELAEAYKWATDEEFAALLRQVKKIALQRNLGRVLNSLYHYTQRADVSANQMHTRVVSELENCFAGYSDQRQAYTAYEGLTMLAEELQGVVVVDVAAEGAVAVRTEETERAGKVRQHVVVSAAGKLGRHPVAAVAFVEIA